MFFAHPHPLDKDKAAFGKCADDFTRFASIVAGDDRDHVSFFNMKFRLHIIS